MSKLQRISRAEQRNITLTILKRQGGVCAICGKAIDPSVMGHNSDYILDHCHTTGEIRGVLHRSCNGAEGKIMGAAARWGAKTHEQEAVLQYLEKVIKYLRDFKDGAGTGLMYHSHKTPEQKAAAAKLKRRKASAKRRAAAKMKGIK